MTRLPTLSLGLAFACALVACDGEITDPNARRGPFVTVPLTFDGGDCAANPDISTIDYTLFDAAGAVVDRVSVAPCGDAEVVDPGEGIYTLEVVTFDQWANLGMRAECAGIDLAADSISACAVTTYTEGLVTDLLWDATLGPGYSEGDCASSEVVTFDYALRDLTTMTEIAAETGVACADELDFGARTPGNYILEFTAYDGGGDIVGEDGALCVFGTSPHGVRSWCRLRD